MEQILRKAPEFLRVLGSSLNIFLYILIFLFGVFVGGFISGMKEEGRKKRKGGREREGAASF